MLIFASGLGVLEAYTWGLKVADEGPFQDMVSKLLLPSDYYPPMFDMLFRNSRLRLLSALFVRHGSRLDRLPVWSTVWDYGTVNLAKVNF